MPGSGSVQLYHGRSPTQSELFSYFLTWGSSDLLIIDESNSFSSRTDGSRHYLTIVCCLVKDVERFKKVIKTFPVRKGTRVKYSNTKNADRRKVIRGIAEQDIVIVESHLVIGPVVWDSLEAKKKLYMRVLSDAVGKALDASQGHTVDVILDTPPVPIDPELATLFRHLDDVGHDVRWFETRRSASDVHLQVHDFITGVVPDHVEDLDAQDLYSMVRGHVVE